MSTPSDNPVQASLDGLSRDSVVYAATGKRMALVAQPDGTWAQLVASVLDPVLAQVHEESRAALVDALTANTGELTTLNGTESEGNDLLAALGSDIADLIDIETAVKLALNASKLSQDAGNVLLGQLVAALGTANDIAAKTLAASQATAAASAAGTNYALDFASAGAQSVMPAPMAADTKVLRVVLGVSTLLGSVLGTTAKVYVYHSAGANDAFNAAGAVLLGTYSVVAPSNYVVVNGRTVPKGRYLRVQATNGGCAVSLDVA